jgi:hypothetical protein
MLLNEAMNADGWDATRYLERYANHTQAYGDISSGDPRYDPQSGDASFTAPTFMVPKEQALLCMTDPQLELLDAVVKNDHVLFVAHPDMANDTEYLAKTGLGDVERLSDGLVVAPTSSTRTLITLGNPGGDLMIKTDYDARLDRVHRRVTEVRVKHSSHIGAALRIATADPSLAELAYLPESAAVTLRLGADDASVIYRELIPRPYATEDEKIVPGFSLYAADMHNPDQPPLGIQLAQLHAAKGGQLDYFRNEVCGPLIDVWGKAVQKHGLLVELHGQNASRELSRNGQLGRVVYRDFQSTHVDADIRTNNGLAVDHFRRAVLSDTIDPEFRQKQHSYIYDHIIGDLLLKRLTNTFSTHFTQWPERIFTSALQSYFREVVPSDLQDLLPGQTYRVGTYGPNNKAEMVVSHKKPIFR